MKWIFMLFLIWHLEEFGLFNSESKMMLRANELSRNGIKVIFLYPTSYGTSAKLIWAEESK